MRRSEARPSRAAVEAPISNGPEPRRPLSRLAAVGGRTRISLLACLIALGLAGCGSDDGTIPQSQSSDLLALLDNVQETADTGDCDHASEFAREFANRVDELPSDVDADVREELNKAAANLDQLAGDSSQCKPPPETGASDTGGVLETTESTSTVEESTTTTTTDEEPDTTTSTTEEEPSNQGNQGNQGNEGTSGQTTPPSPPTPPSTPDQGEQGGSGGGVEPPSGGVGAGGNAG